MKNKGIILFLLATTITIAFCSCNVNPPNQVSSKTSITPEVQKNSIYKFFDKSVQKAAEEFLGKKANKFSEADIIKLNKMTYFSIDDFLVGPVKTLKDIPTLFPKIKFLNIGYAGQIPQADMNILKGLQNLKALSLTTSMLPSLDFINKLPYFEIEYNEEGYKSTENNLKDFSLLGRDFIISKMHGHLTKYSRLRIENQIFEFYVSDYISNKNDKERFYDKIERNVFVSNESNGEIKYKTTLDASYEMGDFPSNRLYFNDVNFDGQKDLLIDNGHFGTQGLVTFSCFLQKNGEYNLCSSFSDIPNPALDFKNKKVLGTVRNMAVSHSWLKFSFTNNSFEMTDRLTEEPKNDNWNYTIEKLINGKMKKIAEYSEKNTSRKKIDNLFYNKNSSWNLIGNQWRTIFNMGSLKQGYSIYGNDDINQTIIDVIR
ncbi:MAG: hypothetical protein WCL54_02650 [Clostridia bacterium]